MSEEQVTNTDAATDAADPSTETSEVETLKREVTQFLQRLTSAA